jgi:hypothetical protein
MAELAPATPPPITKTSAVREESAAIQKFSFSPYQGVIKKCDARNLWARFCRRSGDRVKRLAQRNR